VLSWAAQVGVRTLLVSPPPVADKELITCIGSLAELPTWLQQQV
jgi:hypothetical protein